jgi:hypothetical protein
MTQRWPELGSADWRGTCSAPHLYLQVAGKYRAGTHAMAEPLLARHLYHRGERLDIISTVPA